MSQIVPTQGSPVREIRGIVPHLLYLLVSAVLLALAFPRPGIWFLAHIALVPMFVLALRSTSVRRLLWTGFTVGWLWWLVMIRWMIPVTAGGWIALAGYMAIYMPLALVLVRLLDRKVRLPMTFALPLVWVSLEYVRCHGLEGGFAWFALGHSQGPVGPFTWPIPISQIADLFGQHGVSFLVAMSNGLLVDLVTRPLFSRREKKIRPAPVTTVAVASWIAAFLGAWIYGLASMEASHAYFKRATVRLTASVVQTNIPQDNKDHGTDQQRRNDWERLLELTKLAANESFPATDSQINSMRPSLIVWPETMVPLAVNPEAVVYQNPAGSSHAAISASARTLHVALLVGSSALLDWRPYTVDGVEYVEPTRKYNSAFLYQADGIQDAKRYDKIHRVPFGEYIPWTDGRPALKKMFLKTLSPYGDFDYTIASGRSRTVFELPCDAAEGKQRIRFTTPICFEDAMPHLCREMIYNDQGGKRADVLINLTNDGWFAGSDQPLQHLQIAAFRCIENRVCMARSVNTGISAFIDTSGHITGVVERDGRFENIDGFKSGELWADPRVTLFGRIGHTPIHVMMAVTAILVIYCLLPRKKA